MATTGGATLTIHAFKAKRAMHKSVDAQLPTIHGCRSPFSGFRFRFGAVPHGPTWWTFTYSDVVRAKIIKSIGGELKSVCVRTE
jgi:hypothetical protein